MKFKVWCMNKNKVEPHPSFIKTDGSLWKLNEFGIIPLNEKTHKFMLDTSNIDKSGTKIYVGDIVLMKNMKQPTGIYDRYHDVYYEIISKDNMFYAKPILNFEFAKYYYTKELIYVCEYCEVVGNKYENKEIYDFIK